MLPTLLAAAGDPDINKKLLNGYKVGDKTFKVHLDGYNMLPYLTGEVKESPRNSIFYFSDDGDVMAVRVGDYKFNLAMQRAHHDEQWAGAVREASACRTSSISGVIRSSAPTSTRTPTGTGWSITSRSST